MLSTRDLVREIVSQYFCFLEVEENIWPKRCYPEMLADGKARESASRACASCSETTVFDEEEGESLTHCCSQAQASVAQI